MPIDFVATAERAPRDRPLQPGHPRRRASVHRRPGRASIPPPGELVDGGIAEQTERVLQNLRAILQAGGLDLASVVKTTVFLVDMADFAAMNEVYARAFGDHRPARSTVAVAALPRGARVEIEAIAAP